MEDTANSSLLCSCLVSAARHSWAAWPGRTHWQLRKERNTLKNKSRTYSLVGISPRGEGQLPSSGRRLLVKLNNWWFYMYRLYLYIRKHAHTIASWLVSRSQTLAGNLL